MAFWIPAAIGAGTSILGGILGSSAAASESEQAEGIINDSIRRIQSLQIPDVQKRIIYDQYMSAGDFTPQMLDKVIEETAPLALLKEDPKYRAKMESTLARQEQATRGPSAQFELGLEKSRRRTAQDVLAQMATIESQAQRAGQSSGGAKIASQLKAIQAGADRQSMEGLESAAQAEQLQSQNLESFIRNLSSEEGRRMEMESQNVRARNLRDELLMQNAMAREQTNKGAMNQAALRNLAERQRALESNVGTNIAEQRRVGYEAPMNMFQMQMSKANAENALQGQLAQMHMNRGQAKADMWNTIGSGAGKLGLGLYGSYLEGADPAQFKKLFGGGGGGGGQAVSPVTLNFGFADTTPENDARVQAGAQRVAPKGVSPTNPNLAARPSVTPSPLMGQNPMDPRKPRRKPAGR